MRCQPYDDDDKDNDDDEEDDDDNDHDEEDDDDNDEEDHEDQFCELASVGWKIGAKPVSTSLPSPTINDASFYFFQGAPLQQSSFENKPFGIIVLVRRYSMWPVDFA